MFKKLLTRTLVSAVLAATASTALAADATDWPKRPIQVVVPAGAGGDTDFNARTMAKYFTQLTGKSMVVTNMGGGGGTIAVSHVQGSNPDGNTIFFGHTGQLVVNEVAGLADYSYDVLDIACIAAVDKGRSSSAARPRASRTSRIWSTRPRPHPAPWCMAPRWAASRTCRA